MTLLNKFIDGAKDLAHNGKEFLKSSLITAAIFTSSVLSNKAAAQDYKQKTHGGFSMFKVAGSYIPGADTRFSWSGMTNISDEGFWGENVWLCGEYRNTGRRIGGSFNYNDGYQEGYYVWSNGFTTAAFEVDVGKNFHLNPKKNVGILLAEYNEGRTFIGRYNNELESCDLNLGVKAMAYAGINLTEGMSIDVFVQNKTAFLQVQNKGFYRQIGNLFNLAEPKEVSPSTEFQVGIGIKYNF